MKNIVFIFCFLFFTYTLFSQVNYPFFKNMKGERKLLADTVITRVAPSTGAAFDDTLLQGTLITILMQVPYSEVRNNVASPWLKVMYKKGKYNKVSFISAIDVAINEKIKNKNIEFIWGVVANSRKDSLVNGEIKSFNIYQCKLVALQENKKVAENYFKIDDFFNVDSIAIQVIEKIKLKNAMCAIEIKNYNLKDTTKEFFKRTFVFCKSKNIVELPLTHSYHNLNDTRFPTSTLNYSSKKNEFILLTDYRKLMPENIIEVYKWQNCSYTLIQ